MEVGRQDRPCLLVRHHPLSPEAILIPRPESSEQIQLQRLIARAGPDADPDDARARIASQQPLSSKLPYADYVVDNSGDRAELERQVADTVRKIRKQVWTPIWLVSWLVPPIGLLNALFTVMWRLVIKRVGKGSRGGQRKRT